MIQIWQQILKELLVLNRASETSTCRTILANNLVVETVEAGECFGFIYELDGQFVFCDESELQFFSDRRKGLRDE
jgi:hypothetical protein